VVLLGLRSDAMADDLFAGAPKEGDYTPEPPAVQPGQEVPASLAPPVRFVRQGEARTEPRAEPGFLEGAGQGLESAVAGAAETGEMLANRLRGKPPAEPTESPVTRPDVAELPVTEGWRHPYWWGHMFGRGAPAMAAYGVAGGPLGGMFASGLTQFVTEYGPAFRANLEAGIPEDQALRGALQSSGVSAAATAAMFGLPLRVFVQVLGQPTIGAGAQIIQNYLTGLPPEQAFQGAGEAALAGMIGAAPVVAGKAAGRVWQRIRGKPEAEPKPEPEAPPAAEPKPPAAAEDIFAGAPREPGVTGQETTIVPPSGSPAPSQPERPGVAPDLFDWALRGGEGEPSRPPAQSIEPPSQATPPSIVDQMGKVLGVTPAAAAPAPRIRPEPPRVEPPRPPREPERPPEAAPRAERPPEDIFEGAPREGEEPPEWVTERIPGWPERPATVEPAPPGYEPPRAREKPRTPSVIQRTEGIPYEEAWDKAVAEGWRPPGGAEAPPPEPPRVPEPGGLSPSETRLLTELQSKPREGWERNGYEDGLANNYRGEGRGAARDSYMLGYRDGEQVRRILESAREPAPAPARARGGKPQSLMDMIRQRGISPDDPLIGDVRSMDLPRGYIRKGGLTLDQLREAAVIGRYLDDPGYWSGAEATSTVPQLLDAMDRDWRARKAKSPEGRVWAQGEEAAGVRRPDEYSQGVAAAEKRIRDAFREQGLRDEELDPDTLRSASEALYRGEVDDPREAYDQAAAWREEAYGEKRPGVRGGGEEVYPGREPGEGPRGEEAPLGPSPREQGPGEARQPPRQEASPEDLGFVDYLAQREVGRKIDLLDSLPLNKALSELPIPADWPEVPRRVAEWIRTRLARIVGDTPVHFISERDLQDFTHNSDPTKRVNGLWVQDADANGKPRTFIFVNADQAWGGSPADRAHTLLHEATHAATQLGIETSKQVKKAIKLMMGALKPALKTPEGRPVYALTDPHEFVAEVFSNPILQEALHSAPTPKAFSEMLGRVFGNAWDAMVELVRRSLGVPTKFKPGLEKIMEAREGAPSLLETAMTLGQKAIEATEPKLEIQRAITRGASDEELAQILQAQRQRRPMAEERKFYDVRNDPDRRVYEVVDRSTGEVAASYKYGPKESDRGVAHGRANVRRNELNQRQRRPIKEEMPQPSPEYQRAIDEHDKAYREYDEARQRFRKGNMSTATFGKAAEKYKEATAKFDAAYAKEAGEPAPPRKAMPPGAEGLFPKEEPGAEGKPQLVIPGAEQRSTLEFARGRPNERELLEQRLRQIAYDRRLSGTQEEPSGERSAIQRRLKELRTEAPLKPKVEQKPMDVGLFGDDVNQGDLFSKRFPLIMDAANEAMATKSYASFGGIFRAAGRLVPKGAPEWMRNPTEARVKTQDAFLRWRRAAEQWMRDNPGAVLPDEANPYQVEALSHGKRAAREKAAEEDYTKPLAEQMAKDGLGYDEFGEYAQAMHAEERNRELRRINPNLADPAGMSDAEAQRIKAAAVPRQAAFDRSWKILRNMIDGTLDGMVRDGLLDAQTAAAWRSRWPNYVPMRHTEIGDIMGIGRGADVRGKESQQAFGRLSRADNPIQYAMMQMNRAIARGEKNKVGAAVDKFVNMNREPDLWSTTEKPMYRYIDPKTGQVAEMVHPMWKQDPGIYIWKDNGVERHVYFKGEYGGKLIRALKNMEQQPVGDVLRGISWVTRQLARLNTSLNPEFVISNFIRDAGEAFINLPADQQARLVSSFRKHLVPALEGAWSGPEGGTSFQAQRYRDFVEDGGKIGFSWGMDAAEHQANFEKMLARAQDGTLNTLKNAAGAVVNGIDRINMTIENTTRLAVYNAARDNGFSRPQAAMMAREATVNFNRRGEQRWLSSLYMFANAGLQGTVRGAQALKNSVRARKAARALTASGAALATYNIFAGGTAEDGQSNYSHIPAYRRELNFIFMDPSGSGKYVMIPKPFFFGMFAGIGDHMAQFAFDHRNAAKAASGMFWDTIKAVDPLGQDEGWSHFVPTIAKPISQLLLNKDAFGRTIYPDEQSWSKFKPKSEGFTLPGTSAASKWAARTLNEWTGGDKKTPGYVDIHPEVLDYLTGFVTGGLGRFGMNMLTSGTRWYNGQEWQQEKIPFARRFYGEAPTPGSMRALYREQRLEVEAAAQRKTPGPEMRAAPAFKAAQKANNALYKQRDAIAANPNLTDAQKDQRFKKIDEQQLANMLRARRVLERGRAAVEKRAPTF